MKGGDRVTVWITGDQCSLGNTALKSVDPRTATVLMIESITRGSKLRYHKKKLTLIYSVMRHFARELKELGWEVDYRAESPDFAGAVGEHIDRYKPNQFLMMEQSEYGATQELTKMLGGLPISIMTHCNFVSTAQDFEEMHTGSRARVTMDRFYRKMRKKTRLLMDGDQPLGGNWNFDKDNRRPPGKSFQTAPLKDFPPDNITQEVLEMVERRFGDHPGSLEGWSYAVCRKEALEAAQDFFDNRLDAFGPYQDGMVKGQPFLNHSVLSPYLNTCLLHPLELCEEAEKRFLSGKAPLSSVEGFIRQLIGWREFVWRAYWRMMPEYKHRNQLDANEQLPDFYWSGDTNMACMRDALKTVHDYGYAHHIVRLMLLGNFALIAGFNPQETNDWFTCMFVDGYDWVMVPNVIGMTLHADDGYVGTKPYAASANYINKMSNYCRTCHYDEKETTGKRACPFNSLYWHFLMRNRASLAKNPRMSIVMKALESKSALWKSQIKKRAEDLRRAQWQ